MITATILNIENCYLTGCIVNIVASESANGFIGYIDRNANTISIKNSYMLGTLTNPNNAIFTCRGDYQTSSFIVENCFYNPEGVLSENKLQKDTYIL